MTSESPPPPQRTGLIGLIREMGPGYMQSAMTLGGGTAFSAIFAGAAFGYQLLWVAPLSMLLGVIVLSAVAHQTVHTDEDPFKAMKTYAGSFFAYAWGIGAILSSIVWQFAQYGLAAAMIVMLAGELGWTKPDTNGEQVASMPSWLAGALALAWCVTIGLLYDRSPRLVRAYETVLKLMVWLIIGCFVIVVIRMGIPEPGAMVRGFIPSWPKDVPVADGEPIKTVVVVVSGLSAAVGVNMLFVYPYSLRRRGWGADKAGLARADLIWGMLVPYTIAASLILIAAAGVLHYAEPELFEGKKISPAAVAKILASPDRLGPGVGAWVFGLGIIAMALSSITMQMLSSGFACEVMFGWKRGTRLHAVGTLMPAIGVLGAVVWGKMVMWVAVPTNVVCGLMLPAAYIGFILLQRSKRYLGENRPEGPLAKAWIVGMVVATLVLVVGLANVVITEAPGFWGRLAAAFN